MKGDKSINHKVYVSTRKHIKSSIIKALAIVIGIDVFFYLAARGFNDPLIVGFISILFFLMLICGFSVIHNNKVLINEDYIGFQALYNPKEPKIYKWKDVNMCVVGDVEVKYSRMPYNVFGVQIFYFEKYASKSYATFYTYPLRHLNAYEELIQDIKRICNKNNIKYLDQRDQVSIDKQIEP